MYSSPLRLITVVNLLIPREWNVPHWTDGKGRRYTSAIRTAHTNEGATKIKICLFVVSFQREPVLIELLLAIYSVLKIGSITIPVKFWAINLQMTYLMNTFSLSLYKFFRNFSHLVLTFSAIFVENPLILCQKLLHILCFFAPKNEHSMGG